MKLDFEKNKILILAVAAALIIGGVIGGVAFSSKADGVSNIGYVNVSYLLKEYVYPKVQEPIQAELEKYQAELDEKIEALEGTEEEKNEKAQELYAEYQQKLDQKEQELAQPYLEEVKKAIENVAGKQGLQIVIDNAPTGVQRPVVVWGGVDITQAVLEHLGDE